MYKRIGKKIKGLARAIFIIEAIMIAILVLAGVVSALSTLFAGSMFLLDFYAIDEIGVLEIVALILAVVCVIVIAVVVFAIAAYLAYMSTWLLYAFGELVDKTCDIEMNTRKTLEPVFTCEPSVKAEELTEEAVQNGEETIAQ